MPDQNQPQLLSIQGAANLLGVSPFTIREHVARANIKVTRIGRRIRISPVEISRIVASGLPSLTPAQKPNFEIYPWASGGKPPEWHPSMALRLNEFLTLNAEERRAAEKLPLDSLERKMMLVIAKLRAANGTKTNDRKDPTR